MKKREFLKLKEYEWNSSVNEMEIGDRFLMGESMISQKEEVSEYASYYIVTDKKDDGNAINIEVKIVKLEE